jgi:hypothetical protein
MIDLTKYKLSPTSSATPDLAKYKVAAKPADNRDLLQKASDVVKKSPFGFVAPLGEAVGRTLGGIKASVQQRSLGPLMAAGEQNNANFGKVVGSTIASAALPASLAVGGGTGASALARLGSSALKFGASSAALGGGQALAEGQSVPDAIKAGAKSGAIGAALGGATQGAGELINAAMQKLPHRLVRQALPKLEKGNEEYALKNTKVAPIHALAKESDATVAGLGKQVHTVLEHPQYIDNVGAGDFAIKKTLNAFPNSEYDAVQVVNTIKRLVPAQARLVDKVAAGTATLPEKNQLRAAIDPVIKKVFTDAPEVSSSKKLAAEFANALRGEVQSFAPETQPIFGHLSKEINLRNALESMNKKLDTRSALGLYDIVAGLGGFATGGPVGTVVAIGAEKALRSPAVGLAAAKGLSSVIPAANVGANAARSAAIPLTASGLGQSGQSTSQQLPGQSQSLMPQSSPNPTMSPQQRQAVLRGVEVGKMVDPTGGLGGVLKAAPKAAKALANIHPDDLHLMERFIDYARVGKNISDDAFAQAEKLAQRFGISMDLGLKRVANEFEKVLQGKRDAPDTVVQARDVLGRFIGSK